MPTKLNASKVDDVKSVAYNPLQEGGGLNVLTSAEKQNKGLVQ